jgi:hypothetical protein
MTSRLRIIALSVLAAAVLAGCGANAETGPGAEAVTDEGQYLEVGGLKYQVQISRQLNPSDDEDRGYLIGLPSGTSTRTAPGEEWFAVFMRVQNDGDRTGRATSDYTITDTQGNTFRPVPLGAQNVFAYRPRTMVPGDLIPVPNSAAASDPIQGSLILFKLKTDDLQNRPLTLHIGQGSQRGQSASVELDL